MKIVHSEASCGWGGQEIRIIEESRGMIERGHEVIVVCPPESRIFSEAPKRGIPVVALPIGKKRLKGAMAFRAWLKSQAVDVINTHSSTDSWLAAIACKTMSKPPAIVRTRHISAPITKNPTTRWLYTRATKHIVTTGEMIRQQLIRDNDYAGEMITSVPTGIDTQRFLPGDKTEVRQKLGLEPDGKYLGIVATLRSWKGHLFLLEAFARLDAPQWKLLIVGEGPMRDPIMVRMNELGLANRVLLTGQQDYPEAWMQALDIFCLPSYANEGVPQAILQAMLTGLPIVTTAVGAITEAVEHDQSALIVPARDASALSVAIARLMRDPELGARLGKTARESAVERFSKESMLDKMTVIFDLVAGKE